MHRIIKFLISPSFLAGFGIFLFLFLMLPHAAFAQACQSDESGYCLEVPLPAFPEKISGPAEYIGTLFTFALIIVGVVTLVVLISAGSVFIFSAGNATLVSDAKDRILKALIGLILVLSAWLILNAINPDLLVLSQPDMINPPGAPSWDEVRKKILGTKAANARCSGNIECTGSLVCRPSFQTNTGPMSQFMPMIWVNVCQPPGDRGCDSCDDTNDCAAGFRCERAVATWSCPFAKGCRPIAE